MTIIELTAGVVSAQGKMKRLRVLSGMIALIVVAGCAPQSSLNQVAYQDSGAQSCPPDYIPHCEVWGGNKFKKRYGLCRCTRSS